MLNTEVLAATLLHFLWQGAGLTAGGVLLLWMLPRSNAQRRYAVWLGVMVGMILAPLLTLSWLNSTAAIPLPIAGDLSGRTALDTAATSGMVAESLPPEMLALLVAELVESHSAIPDPASAGSPDNLSLEAGRWGPFLPSSQTIVMIWVVGLALTSLRLIGALTWMSSTIQRLKPAPESVQPVAQRLAQRMGLLRMPGIFLSADVVEPLALLWWRPLVILPASWLANASPETVEAVLAHELAHIRRYDLWVNLAQRLAETLLFFHPCVWWVSRQIRLERELCCDVDAVAATGQPVAYAQALEVMAWQRRRQTLPQFALGWGGTRMALLHRVKRVLGVESSASETNWWTLGLAGAGVGTACWLGSTLWTNPAQGDERSGLVAQADREREGDRPRGEGPREGERGDRGPDRERFPPREEGRREDGRHEDGPPRPPHEIVKELSDAFRALDQQGEAGQRQKQELIHHLVRMIADSAARPPRGDRIGLPGPPHIDGPRPGHLQDGEPGHGPGAMEGHRIIIHGGPPPLHAHDEIPPVMQAVRELRMEVERLRDEMHQLRQERPQPGPRLQEARPRGPREDRAGMPRGPREEEAGPPRGPREGNGPGRPGPRDGEAGGPPRGPRDGEAGPPRGPREGEPRPPREGGEDRPRPPREEEGDRPRPPREESDENRADAPAAAEDAPISALIES